MISRYAALIGATLYLSGCVVEAPGPAQHDFRSVEMDDSKAVRLDLNMGAGNLRVGAGTQKLMRADFTYNVPSWKPYVRYSSNAGHGDLSIEQPSQHQAHLGHTKYEWDVRLTREIPMDMRVHFGAGEANLDLGSLSLRSVAVEMGVGKMQMDLRGNPKHSYEVNVRGGVGEATIRLPADVGIEAQAEGGIGDIKVRGLKRDGHRYFNEAYDTAKVRIHVDVRGGIGAIRLIAE